MNIQFRRTRGIRARRLGLAAGIGAASSLAGQALAAEADTATALDSVKVTAAPSLTKLSTQLQNTGQNIDVIPQQVLTEQAIATVQDALKNVPGITLNAGEGGTHGDNINLRGFAASDDFFLDGLRDTGFYTRDSFNLEALEVYKGPASTLFGRGSTGGVVNQVSKTPKLDGFARGTIVGGANDEVRGTADVDYALRDDAAVRLTGMAQDAGVAGRDYVKNRRWGVAPSAAIGIGKPVTLTLGYFHETQDDIPDYGIPFAFGRPVPVARSSYYGLPSDDRNRTNVDVGTLQLKADLAPNVWFTDTARDGRYFFDSRETAAHYGAALPAPGTPLSTVLTFRDRPSVQGAVTTLMNDANLHARFESGMVSNTVVVGVEADHEESRLTRFANQLNNIPGTPILHPDPNEPFPGHQTAATQYPVTRTDTLSGLVEDTLAIGDHFEATGAVRYDRFSARFDEPLTNVHLNHVDTIASPRVSLVYKVDPRLSLYASYGTSYDPSAEALSLTAKTASLAPEKDETFEVGAKANVLSRLSLQAAVFQTTMLNARVGDPTNPANPQILAGKEQVKGVEIDAIGHLTPQIEIVAGYTHLDSRTLASSDKASVGAPLLNVGPNQANLWLVYEPAEAWKVGAGLNYLDARAADVDDTAHVPAYTTVDAMVSYRVNGHLSLQVNATNLADTYYFANSYFSSPLENHVTPGPGRTVLVTASLSY
ncbi:MAG TPA: TonB-dependent siderophore receptor [Caulobacteraceae bacterium]